MKMEIVFPKREVVDVMKMIGKNGMTVTRDGKDHLEIAKEMINEVDVDRDGIIDIDEFIDIMKKGDKVNLEDNGQIPSAFLSYNHKMPQFARDVLLSH